MENIDHNILLSLHDILNCSKHRDGGLGQVLARNFNLGTSALLNALQDFALEPNDETMELLWNSNFVGNLRRN